jgi:hypothetical protein
MLEETSIVNRKSGQNFLLTVGRLFHYGHPMSEHSHIKDLIDTWPTRKALAEQIGANVDAVHKWAATNRIPSDWQARVIKAAQACGLTHVTGDWMVAQHDKAGGAS